MKVSELVRLLRCNSEQNFKRRWPAIREDGRRDYE